MEIDVSVGGKAKGIDFKFTPTGEIIHFEDEGREGIKYSDGSLLFLYIDGIFTMARICINDNWIYIHESELIKILKPYKIKKLL